MVGFAISGDPNIKQVNYSQVNVSFINKSKRTIFDVGSDEERVWEAGGVPEPQ